MRFLHAADLHLGCLPNHSALRWQDFFDRLKELVDLALERDAEVVVLAGDFFHHRNIDAQTLRLAGEQLLRLKTAGIPVAAVEGNHDKAFYTARQSWLAYLNSVGLLHLLKPVYLDGQPHLTQWDGETGAIWEYGDVRFVGFGFLGGATRERLSAMAPELPPSERFTVGILHTGVDRLMGLDMGAATTAELEQYRGRVDYFALGHVHTAYQVQDWAFNPGAPESVSLLETKHGEKGFYLVDTDGKTFRTEWIPSRCRPFGEREADITGIAPEQLPQRVTEACRGMQPGDMLRLILTGTAAELPDTALLQRVLTETCDLAVCEVEDRSGAVQRADLPRTMTQSQVERHVLTAMAQEQGLPPEAGNDALALCGALLEGIEPESLYDALLRRAKEWGKV